MAATHIASINSSCVAPNSTARFACWCIQDCVWWAWATAKAMSSLIFAGSAPSARTASLKALKRSRIWLVCWVMLLPPALLPRLGRLVAQVPHQFVGLRAFFVGANLARLFCFPSFTSRSSLLIVALRLCNSPKGAEPDSPIVLGKALDYQCDAVTFGHYSHHNGESILR